MNYKIRVANEAESKEVQELLFKLGYLWLSGDNDKFHYLDSPYLYTSKDMGLWCGYCHPTFNENGNKEISIDQMRDMVVLKRNDPKDENVYQDGDVPCLYNLYLTSDKNLYFFFCGKGWRLSAINDDDDYRKLLKPITKEPTMKEYINKLTDGTYKLVLLDSVADGVDGLIEVPEGADTLAGDSSTRYFWKHGVGEKGNMIIGVGESLTRYSGWTGCEDSADVWLDCVNDDSFKIIWQRETLNDKVASAEAARQEFIGAPFSDLPEFKFEAVDDFVESNVEQGVKHSHYKKDISHLDILDIYRVTELFNPHSCGAHIAKKALCSGQRGHKDLLTDIQDIIDTSERWKEMLIEDEKAK